MKDDDGKTMPWQIDEEDWHTKLKDCEKNAVKAVDDTRGDDSGAWQHAGSTGATEKVRQLSIRYAQWSIASETAIAENNPDAKVTKHREGRGLPTKYRWTTIADRSGSKVVGRLIWSPHSPLPGQDQTFSPRYGLPSLEP